MGILTAGVRQRASGLFCSAQTLTRCLLEWGRQARKKELSMLVDVCGYVSFDLAGGVNKNVQ